MKKYVLYTWHSDNGEGGTGVCYAKDFVSDLKFHHSNCHDNFLTEFDTPYEAAKYLRAVHNLSVDEMKEVEEDIKYRLYCFHFDKGEYDEAAMYEGEPYEDVVDDYDGWADDGEEDY